LRRYFIEKMPDFENHESRGEVETVCAADSDMNIVIIESHGSVRGDSKGSSHPDI
jgi:hypothetical protein